MFNRQVVWVLERQNNIWLVEIVLAFDVIMNKFYCNSHSGILDNLAVSVE